PSLAVDRARQFCGAGAGVTSSSADICWTRCRRSERSGPPQTRDDHRRSGPHGGGPSHVAGAFALHGLAGLSAAAAGNYHGRVLRAGTEFCDFSPIVEGVRYVRRDARLFATILVKAGLLVIGPSWVLFTVMGQRYFPVRWQGIDAQRGAMLGMSLLMASRGLGALLGPLLFASI